MRKILYIALAIIIFGEIGFIFTRITCNVDGMFACVENYVIALIAALALGLFFGSTTFDSTYLKGTNRDSVNNINGQNATSTKTYLLVNFLTSVSIILILLLTVGLFAFEDKFISPGPGSLWPSKLDELVFAVAVLADIVILFFVYTAIKRFFASKKS